jgi:hypothetical protein
VKEALELIRPMFPHVPEWHAVKGLASDFGLRKHRHLFLKGKSFSFTQSVLDARKVLQVSMFLLQEDHTTLVAVGVCVDRHSFLLTISSHLTVLGPGCIFIPVTVRFLTVVISFYSSRSFHSSCRIITIHCMCLHSFCELSPPFRAADQ